MKRIVEFIFAPRANCQGCGSELGADNGWLCSKCYSSLAPLTGRTQVRSELCPACGDSITKAYCSRCRKRVGSSLSASAAFVYRPPMDRVIRRFKYSGVFQMDEWLGKEVFRAFCESGSEKPALIVPVPLHIARKILRGYNQSERLAKVISREMNVPYENALVRVRNTRRQATLPREKRRTNLQNAFRAARSLNGEVVLLVDDVRTTGSTVAECARALLKAGAKKVCVATIARTEEEYKNEM